MSFDLAELRRAVVAQGHVARVVIAQTKGSAPRDAGASMLVWTDGQSGTIGGGALELDAVNRARNGLNRGDWCEQVALGPGLGQCCGGAVTLVGETYDSHRLRALDGNPVLRRISGKDEAPLVIRRTLQQHRSSGDPISLQFAGGWLLEAVSEPGRKLWIYGAGHVGRAIVNVLAPLPDFDITWIDSASDRFPENLPDNVTKLVAKNPADVVKFAPTDGEHLVLTYSHAFDLEICHQLLTHSFAQAGVIGSKTKWARFCKRLRTLGHSDAHISQINCPIGRPELGKHPQAIAVGIASTLLAGAVSLEYSFTRVG